MMHRTNNIVLTITGASGGPYAVRLLDCLEAAGEMIHLVVSPHGQRLLTDECGPKKGSEAFCAKHPSGCSGKRLLTPFFALIGRRSERVIAYDYNDLSCRLASGSFLTDGMVICPCSSNTLGAVAAGLGDNLITRAAHVTLKEGRPLVLVHREMPVTGIDLENMLKLQRAGATICPASPGFYLRPAKVADLVDFVVGRVLDLLGVPHQLNVRWEGGTGE